MMLASVGAACTVPDLWHHLTWARYKSKLERSDPQKHLSGGSGQCSRMAVLASFESP